MMRLTGIIPFLFIAQTTFAQARLATYNNTRNAYYNKSNPDGSFLEARVNEIILKTDSTYDFWSKPHMSCFTWHHYKGKWGMAKDTLSFCDSYEITESDIKMTYKRDSRKLYRIRFATDNHSDLRKREVKIEYVYDFDAHLSDAGRTYSLNKDSQVEIPFKDIPGHDQLASIRIVYQLNDKESRYGYLTEGHFANKKKGPVPNIIDVTFIEHPKKEIVHRTVKGIIQENRLVILSITKSQTTIPDRHREIMMEDSYVLEE